MATLPKTEPDTALIERTVKGLDRPDGVGPPRIEIGLDHSGDRSAYVRFRVTKSMKLDRGKVRRLTAFANEVTDALFALGTGLLFYVRFED